MADGATPTLGFHRILVPTDLGPRASSSLEVALGLAARDGARVQLYFAHAGGADDPESGSIASALTAIADAASAAAEAGTVVEHQVADDVGSPGEGILARARAWDADLVVMATQGGSLLAGGVAERVVTHAPCPVLVLHGSPEPEALRSGRWVVGVDGSEAAHRAVGAAMRIVGRGDGIVAVAARGPEGGTIDPSAITTSLPDDVGKIVIIHAPPIRAILDEARAHNAVAIAVGRRGRVGQHPLEIGKVPLRLVRSSPVPVLVVA